MHSAMLYTYLKDNWSPRLTVLAFICWRVVQVDAYNLCHLKDMKCVSANETCMGADSEARIGYVAKHVSANGLLGRDCAS